jgi:hypothetical protein
VQQQALAVVETREQVLADALERHDAAAAQATAQQGGRREEEVARNGREHPLDATADEQRLELPPRDLDLGQLRHGLAG